MMVRRAEAFDLLFNLRALRVFVVETERPVCFVICWSTIYFHW